MRRIPVIGGVPSRHERHSHDFASIPPPRSANDAVRRHDRHPAPLPALARQSTPNVVNEAMITPDQVEAALPKLDGLIEDAMARTGVPGAAVAVVYDDEVVYERAFGVREVGKPDPVTPETVFQLASMSKSISSTLVAAVVGDGATTWDAVAADLLPGFALSDPWLSAQVTLRDLFSHRSGLPAYAGDGLTATFGYGREESVRRLRYVSPATPLRVPPSPTRTCHFPSRPTRRPWQPDRRGRALPMSGCSPRSRWPPPATALLTT